MSELSAFALKAQFEVRTERSRFESTDRSSVVTSKERQVRQNRIFKRSDDRFLGILNAQTLQQASSSSHFERPVATEHALAVISSAQRLLSTPDQ